MPVLAFGAIIALTIPFLLFCLWGFHHAPKKRVIAATLLSGNPPVRKFAGTVVAKRKRQSNALKPFSTPAGTIERHRISGVPQ